MSIDNSLKVFDLENNFMSRISKKNIYTSLCNVLVN